MPVSDPQRALHEVTQSITTIIDCWILIYLMCVNADITLKFAFYVRISKTGSYMD